MLKRFCLEHRTRRLYPVLGLWNLKRRKLDSANLSIFLSWNQVIFDWAISVVIALNSKILLLKLDFTWRWGNEKRTNSFLFLPIFLDFTMVTSSETVKHLQNRCLICVVSNCKIQFPTIFNGEFSVELLP